jgi:hypothetical protein
MKILKLLSLLLVASTLSMAAQTPTVDGNSACLTIPFCVKIIPRICITKVQDISFNAWTLSPTGTVQGCITVNKDGKFTVTGSGLNPYEDNTSPGTAARFNLCGQPCACFWFKTDCFDLKHKNSSMHCTNDTDTCVTAQLDSCGNYCQTVCTTLHFDSPAPGKYRGHLNCCAGYL